MRQTDTGRAYARNLLYLGIIAAWGAAAPAFADDDTTPGAAMDVAAAQQTPPAQTGPLTPPASAAVPASDPYARFKQYVTKGFNVPIPGPSAYIDPDPMGLRSALANEGIGYWGYSLNAWTYDTRNSSKVDGRQVYSGQKATLTSYNYLYGTYDLGPLGIGGGQLSASIANVYTTWAAAGPNMTRVGILQYYQSIADGRVELTVGNLANSFTYTGIYVGGNLASGTFGVNASIPSQVGVSSTFLARPGVNVKFNLGNGFYDMAGVQRSVNPDGPSAEQNANPSGLSWAGHHVGNVWIDELGYRRSATPDARDSWVRAGYFRNTSDYLSKKTPGTRQDDNYAVYLLADHQFVRLGDTPAQSARGIYVGASIMHAPADINTFTRYSELRIYSKGPFDARPADMLSFVASRNDFSDYAVKAAKAAGAPTHDESTAVSLSYSGMVVRGVTLTGGVSYIDHPRPVATSDDQRSGLNVQVGAHIYF